MTRDIYTARLYTTANYGVHSSGVSASGTRDRNDHALTFRLMGLTPAVDTGHMRLTRMDVLALHDMLAEVLEDWS